MGRRHGDRESWERLHATALLVVVAIDQVLAFERRVLRLTGDAELQKARRRFDDVCPDTEQLRDLIAHFDDYAVGEGERQTGHREPLLDDEYPSAFICPVVSALQSRPYSPSRSRRMLTSIRQHSD